MKDRYEKQEARGIVVENRFLKWLDNFWYHYKWPTLVIAFFLFVGTVCFVQCSTREGFDLSVAYAGGFSPTQEQASRINEVFSAIAPPDKEGEAPVVRVNTYTVFTEEEARALCTDEDGNFSTYAFNQTKQTTKNNLDQFGTYTKTGEAAVWLVSEYVYETLNLSKIAAPLSDLYEVPPAGAYDAYAVRLCDTELYRYYDALKVLPEDTLIVMPHTLVWGKSSNEEHYREFQALHRAIIEFKAP